MSSVNFVLVNTPTNTARYLTCMIFNKDALATLRTYGLVNVYIDDYGYSKKYKDCLFFLFHLKESRDFDEFEFKLADFTSFYDFYDVITPTNNMRMYVFKVHDLYKMDLFSYKHGRFDEFTRHFKGICDSEVDFSTIKLDITQEIYRFHHYLETIKEDI